ncbi:hypothetical protein B0O99DRAFT_529405 [Bisporella sp. PMI_857]|nr:hypothetical protein B0O99DRAFT_529405 [Bisporella sp. PMI_857]
MRLQCTCSAFFPTNDAFRAHFNEYRAFEEYLSAQLEIYRSHTKANSDDPNSNDQNLNSNDHDQNIHENAERPEIKHNYFGSILNNVNHCPSSPSGIVNFNADVKCEEVYVCCQHVSKRAKNYIKHAEQHQNVSTIKTTYINQMCNKLRKRAANELDLAEKRRLFHVEKSNKKVREVKDVKSKTSGVQSAKLRKVGVISELGFQPVNGINPLEMSFLSSH